MGAYVSVPDCKSKYDVDLNCTINWTDDQHKEFDRVGNVTKGHFSGDGDIAGVGIFSSFVAVTGLALALSLLSVFMRMWKHKIFPFRWRAREGLDNSIRKNTIKPSGADIVEAVVLTCSDVQIFNGAAYAITLRYFRGCTISAYHYNIVANMMLLTCATHLMAITVVREYWKYPWLALVRVVCSLGVFLVTGLLLSNQNADVDITFPTTLPPRDQKDSLMFRAAACFQTNTTQLGDALDYSLNHLDKSLLLSNPGNHIEGWNKYLIIVLWFIASSLAEAGMFIRRGYERRGRRYKLVRWVWRILGQCCLSTFGCCIGKASEGVEEPSKDSKKGAAHRVKRIGQYLLSIYTLIGIGICIWTVFSQASYMIGLRSWVQRSGWLDIDDQGLNVEDDATSFGQLVPICMNGLIIFTFLQMWSSWQTSREDEQHIRDLENQKRDDEGSPNISQSGSSDPSKLNYTAMATSVTATPSTGLMSPQHMSTYFPPHSFSPTSPGQQQGISPFQTTPQNYPYGMLMQFPAQTQWTPHSFAPAPPGPQSGISQVQTNTQNSAPGVPAQSPTQSTNAPQPTPTMSEQEQGTLQFDTIPLNSESGASTSSPAPTSAVTPLIELANDEETPQPEEKPSVKTRPPIRRKPISQVKPAEHTE